MHELQEDNLGEFLKNNPKTIVQFGAPWCGNCRMIKPKFKRLADEHQGISFLYVDAEKLPGTREFAAIENLPTFAAFSDGKLVKQNQGNKIDLVKELVDEIAGN
ncbi:MAG: thioredoxin family protein [Bacteriovoracaceae bacterium]